MMHPSVVSPLQNTCAQVAVCSTRGSVCESRQAVHSTVASTPPLESEREKCVPHCSDSVLYVFESEHQVSAEEQHRST